MSQRRDCFADGEADAFSDSLVNDELFVIEGIEEDHLGG